MNKGALLRYLTVTIRSFFERAATGTSLLLLVLGVLLVGIGSYFYVQSANDFSAGTLSWTWLGLLLVGCWSGVRYLSSFRPNGWNWLKKSHWYWLTSLPTLATGIILSLVVLWPYYIAQISPAVSLTGILVKFILLLLAVAVALLGLSLAVGIRIISSNPYLRVTLFVLASYAAASFLLGNGPTVLHLALAGNSNSLVMALLFATGLIGTSVVILQLVFDRLALREQSSHQFWNASGATRLLNQVHQPVVSYFLTKVVWYVRASTFHRRLIGYFALVFAAPYAANVFQLGSTTTRAIELLLGWLGVFLIARVSGERSVRDSKWLETQPIRFVPARADLLATLIVVVLVIAATIQFFSAPLVVTQFVSGLCAAIVIFNASRNASAEQPIGYRAVLHHDRVLLGGTVVSLLFVALPILLLPRVSVTVTSAVMIIWLIGVTLSGIINRRIQSNG